MAESITMATDWGAKGAQLTGAQVQAFLKAQLKSLLTKSQSNQNNIASLAQQLRNHSTNISINTNDIAATKTSLNNLELTFNQSLNTLETYLRTEINKIRVADSCFILCVRKNDTDEYKMIPWWEWVNYGITHQAIGVAVMVDGFAPLVVALNEYNAKWSSLANSLMSSQYDKTQTYNNACALYNGAANTNTWMYSDAEEIDRTDGNSKVFAPGICFDYSQAIQRENGTPVTIGKNKWWLPSLGELALIWKHKHAVNQCLSVIGGVTQLNAINYFSSSECDSQHVLALNFDGGLCSKLFKNSTAAVRPVTNIWV